MIRFIACVLYLVLFLVLSLPVLLVFWIVGKFNPRLKADLSMGLVSWGFRCITALAGVKLIAKGLEDIPTDTAVLYVGNHRSFFDIVLTCTLFPRVTGYVAKLEMKKAPLLSLWMRNIHCLFLDRNNIREGLKTILAGVEEVKNGYSLCIFPEGTRNKVNDTFLPFKEGSLKIAEKGGVPIVPLTLVNTAQIFEDHLPKVKKTTVVIDFGQPVYLDRLDKDTRRNLGSFVFGLIRDRYFQLKEEYFPPTAP